MWKGQKISVKSIRFRIIALVTTVVVILLIILALNNVYAIYLVRNQAFEGNSKTLALYMSQIDQAFEDVENYWLGLLQSSDLQTIEWQDNELEYYTAQSRLKTNMEQAIPSYGYLEETFTYFEESDTWIDAAQYHISGSERSSIKNMVLELIQTEVPEAEKGKWRGVAADGKHYLVRYLRVRDIYVGGCVKVSTLVDRLRREGFGESGHLTFCTGEGNELGDELEGFDMPLTLGKGLKNYRMVGDNSKYLMVYSPSTSGNFGLVSMLSDSSILEGLGSIQVFLTVLIVFILFYLGMLLFAVRRWLIHPLNSLTEAMYSLSQGRLDVRLKQHMECDEFSVVNKAFDDMISQIEHLKIDVYEEKMQRQKVQLQYQKAQLQYLKLQVNPHFYINCLNVIHNLSIMNMNELVQEMTAYLGNHLRYTMEGNSLDVLRKEVDYVKNYQMIQELRFAHSFLCHFDIEEAAMEILVPPLVIQTFVENTVKYQVVAGEMTESYISAKIIRHSGEERIKIDVWDTGDGFSKDILDCLNTEASMVDERGEHFGIRNVQQRLKLIYQGQEEIRFSNHPETGGAWIEISMPIRRSER